MADGNDNLTTGTVASLNAEAETAGGRSDLDIFFGMILPVILLTFMVIGVRELLRMRADRAVDRAPAPEHTPDPMAIEFRQSQMRKLRQRRAR